MSVVAFRLPYPAGSFDVERSFVLQQLGSADATAAFEQRAEGAKGTARRFRKTFVTPGSVDRLTHVRLPRGEDHVEIVIVFSGGETEEPKAARDASLETLRRICPARVDAASLATGGWLSRLPFDDGYAAFAPEDTAIRSLLSAYPGGRILPFPWLFDVACSAILQQRVAFPDARRSFTALLEHAGRGGTLGRAWPDPARLATLPAWQWTALGVDRQRATTLCALAQDELRRPFLRSTTPLPELRRRLLAIPGIGPWTTEMICGLGAGDPDALLVGDLHLPHIAAWAFEGKSRGTDEELARWLARYPGQRFRIAGLLLGGRARKHPLFRDLR